MTLFMTLEEKASFWRMGSKLVASRDMAMVSVPPRTGLLAACAGCWAAGVWDAGWDCCGPQATRRAAGVVRTSALRFIHSIVRSERNKVKNHLRHSAVGRWDCFRG